MRTNAQEDLDRRAETEIIVLDRQIAGENVVGIDIGGCRFNGRRSK